jgi:hypothetical protein
MRRTKEVLIPGERSEELGQRDNGKRFLLTEMPADQAERWATRLYLAMSRSGLDLPDGMTDWGAILAYGALRGLGSIQWSDAEPLLAEMWGCVQIVEPMITRHPTADDIEEVTTRYRLRSEVIELHTGFSPAAMLSALAAEVVRGRSSLNTPTSPDQSEQ